ncbi:MAG: MBL fold metallo-hydrolase, partial [Tepidiformaceae bacterium]
MADIRALSEQLWQGNLDSPEAHPVHGRFPEGEEILENVLFYKGLASANTIDTGQGLVMLDTGAVNDTRLLYESVRRWRPDTPLRSAVFSHHHVDHIFGVGPFEQEAEERHWARPLVYGHSLMPADFERYKKTLGWNTAINKRQFALPLERF